MINVNILVLFIQRFFLLNQYDFVNVIEKVHLLILVV